jgi:aminotransferase
MRERTLVINFFSKTYAMTGLRVGFVYGPEELVSVLWLVHQYSITCVNSLAQYAALAAIRGQQDVVTSMVNEFARRRHLICDGLNEIKGFHCSLPKGAFYAFQNVKDRHASSEELCESLIKNAGVMTVPGSAFGSNVRVICGFPMPHRNNS